MVRTDKYIDIAAFFGNGQFLLPMDDSVRTQFKKDTDEYLRKGLLSASLIPSKHYPVSGSYPSCGDSESPASCAIVDDIVYSLDKPGQGHTGDGVGFHIVYSEALSEDDLKTLATAGMSIVDLVRGSRNCQDKFNTYDPVSDNFVPAVSQAVEDTCLYTLPILHVDVGDVGPPYETDPRMPTPCKIRVKNPDNALATPQAGRNYLPARLASVFTSDYCESKCTLSPRVCNGSRFGPPENVTETA